MEDEQYYTLQEECSVDGLSCTISVPTQMVGDIVFCLAVLIFLNALVACGIFFNTFSRK